MNKCDYVFESTQNYYRQMYKAPASKTDQEIIEIMQKDTSISEQFRITQKFVILTNEMFKEVYSIIPRSKQDD